MSAVATAGSGRSWCRKTPFWFGLAKSTLRYPCKQLPTPTLLGQGFGSPVYNVGDQQPQSPPSTSHATGPSSLSRHASARALAPAVADQPPYGGRKRKGPSSACRSRIVCVGRISASSND